MIKSVICYFVFVLLSSTVRVNSQLCHGISQYSKCSTNPACGCFHMTGAIETGICTYNPGHCSELVSCNHPNNICFEPDHKCVHHPQCHSFPVCFPVASFNQKTCPPVTMTNITTTTTTTTTTRATTTTTRTTQQWVPLRAPAIDIQSNATWTQNGLTVAGGNVVGSGINQLNLPAGLYVDDDQTIYVADQNNQRIVEWKRGATSGQVVAGGNGYGNGAHQLKGPWDVIVDKERDSLIICDPLNRRVVQWPRRNGTSGQTITSNIDCMGLTVDENGSLYVVDNKKHEVRRYRIGETAGTVVAGGNGNGYRLDQLSEPHSVFVDRDHSVYVSQWGNHRVMKWEEGAKQGIVVAGGQGKGSSLSQLSTPTGVVVDQLGTVYVADELNHRIMRWSKGATQGSVIFGGNGYGEQSNQLNFPIGLSFDRHGNLYVADEYNHRVQKFNIQ